MGMQCSSAASDEDGDGWGWENNRSCIVRSDAATTQQQQQTQSGSIPICSSASVDNDNDGWGWENNKTCIVGDSGSAPAEVTPPTGTPVANAFDTCSSSASFQ